MASLPVLAELTDGGLGLLPFGLWWWWSGWGLEKGGDGDGRGAGGGAVFEVSCPSPTFLDADTQLFLALGWLGKWAGSSGC